MTNKRVFFVVATIVSAATLQVASQQTPNVSPTPARPPQTGAGVPPVKDPSEAVAPFRIHPQTGELITAKGERIDDPVLNSPEKRNERLLARWIVENPREYWKAVPPRFPPKGDPMAPQFDMRRPEVYTAIMQARETPAQRKARELASLAIRNPLAYQAELKRLKETGPGK